MRYKSTTVLKRRCTLFEIEVDGNKEYHYISNNDRNTFFRWSKQLRLNNPFTIKEVNKYLNAYFTTKNKHYTVIRHIQQLEEKIRQNESKEKQFLSKIEDMLKQNEILRNKMSSIVFVAYRIQIHL